MTEKIKTITGERNEIHGADHLRSPSEHHESEKHDSEKSDESKSENTVDQAVESAKMLANEADQKRHNEKHMESPARKRHGSPSKRQRSAAFKETMKEVRHEMPLTSRLVSSIIHNRAVETTSDFLASTVARPNALLAGSVVAFISVTLVYFFAKNYGYQLSGFETIGAFVLGWVLGIVYDYVSLGLRNKR